MRRHVINRAVEPDRVVMMEVLCYCLTSICSADHALVVSCPGILRKIYYGLFAGTWIAIFMAYRIPRRRSHAVG